MNSGDIVLENFSDIDIMGIAKIPLITAYYNTFDYPGQYSARLFSIVPIVRPSIFLVLADTLDDLYDKIPEYFTLINPAPEDDPNIIGIFI